MVSVCSERTLAAPRSWRAICGLGLLLVAAGAVFAHEGASLGHLEIPTIPKAAPRPITTDDIAALRSIDTLQASPDGRHFAARVRQGNAATNRYRAAWFIGEASGGSLRFIGDGGDIQFDEVGGVERTSAHWSPDGRWLVYKVRSGDEVQLWRSSVMHGAAEQLTHNPGNVRDFAWGVKGDVIYFTAGLPRSQLAAQNEAKQRNGYNYDEDLSYYNELLLPRMRAADSSSPSAWLVTLSNGEEKPGGEHVAAALAAARRGGFVDLRETMPVIAAGAARNRQGALAWFSSEGTQTFAKRVMFSKSARAADPIACNAVDCFGHMVDLWWSKDGRHVLFWRREQIGDGPRAGAGGNFFQSWTPATGNVSTLLHSLDEWFQECDLAQGDRLICVRETPSRPAHVVRIDLTTRQVVTIADVNPEFVNIELGRVERIEWETPEFPWSQPGAALHGVFPKKAFGYILYPPDFDPRRTYPVFIQPYAAERFHDITRFEHPQHVYAANGFLVLNSQFPTPTQRAPGILGRAAMQQLYSADLGFPNLSMCADSTLRALDLLISRGIVDDSRVGIGGVSMGAYVPMFLLQRYNRIAAVSIASAGWSEANYYEPTRRGRAEMRGGGARGFGLDDWMPRPDRDGRAFWERLDAAAHVEELEAPLLLNMAAAEVVASLRLMRELSAAHKPYDAYVFLDETHVKSQPAHLLAIQNRNLDWFRFWLQGYEDPVPSKQRQYARWRELRAMRDHNREGTPGS
jgi:dipeptidyl aminopeptidase/acylaminoacyl peptidase